MSAARDQAVSAFAATLGRLCDSLPAVAVALVDSDGETVDYAGSLSPFDIKVTAAELQIVLEAAKRSAHAPLRGTELAIRARGGSYAAFSLGEGYAVVARLRFGAFHWSARALSEAARELCAEAGLTLPAAFQNERWLRVDVREEPQQRRPYAVWLAGCWRKVDVIGRVYSDELRARELAFRVGFLSGLEVNLVRERLGRWFADDLIG